MGAHLGPTCKPGGGKTPRRIDYVFANAPARALVVGTQLRWDFGLATHAVLHVELEVGPAPPFPLRVLPPDLSGPADPGWSEAPASAWLASEWEPRWLAPLAAGQIDAAWEVFSQAAEEYLACRVGRAPASAGRAVRARLVPAFSARVGQEGETISHLAAARQLRLRHLRHLVREWPRGPAPLSFEGSQVLAAAKRAAEWGPAACPVWRRRLEALRSLGAVEAAVVLAAEEFGVETRRVAQARRDGWHTFVTTEFARGGGRVYRWVRGQGPVDTPLVQVPGGVAAGPAAELAAVEAGGSPFGSGRMWLAWMTLG